MNHRVAVLLLAAAVVSLTVDVGYDFGNPYIPRLEDRCGQWSDWKNVTCWWPSMAYGNLPKECTFIPLPKRIPSYLKHIIQSRATDSYNAIVYEYEQRGKPARCGYCSRSFKCRSRNVTLDNMLSDDALTNSFQNCRSKEIQPVHEDCNDHAPCEIVKKRGGCSSPLFLNSARISRINVMIKKKDHMGAANELFAAQNDPRDQLQSNRLKRDTGYKYIYGNSNYGREYGGMNQEGYGNRGGNGELYGPGNNSPFDNNRWNQRSRWSFGSDTRSSGYSPIRQHSGQDGYEKPFVPGSQRGHGEHGGFGPSSGPGLHDGQGKRSSPGRSGHLSGDDESFGPGLYEGLGLHGGFGPSSGPDPRSGPGPYGGFGPRNVQDDRSGPGGSSYLNGVDEFFGSGLGGPHKGPGGSKDNFNVFNDTANGPMDVNNGPAFFNIRGYSSVQDSRFNMMTIPYMSLWHSPTGPPSYRDIHNVRDFVQLLMHETVCTDAGNSCLCCCGPYVPNVATKSCEDLRKLIPDIDLTIDALYELELMKSIESLSNVSSNPVMTRGKLDSDDIPVIQSRGGPAKFHKLSIGFK